MAEVVTVLAVAAMLLAAATTASMSWFGREEARRASYDIRTYMQLARAHSVSRNRACRFLIDTATRQIMVWDLNDPVNLSDDIRIGGTTLSKRVSFERPDASTPVTLSVVSGSIFQAVFAQDGTVSAGSGVVSIRAMERFDQIRLLDAGAIKIERWDGSDWVTGS